MNTAYCYKVTGEYGAGSAYSGESTLADCAEAPVTLSPVIATVSASPNPVTGHNVYRATSVGGESATPIATGVTTTSFTDTSSTGLANGYTYYYEVAAVNSAGTGPMSNEANAPYDSLSALTLDGLAAVSGYTGSGTVTLATTAQNAITVSLSSSDPSITVPATAIVPAGSSTATFSYTVGNVGSETSVTMTASTNTSLSQTIDSVPAIKLDAVGTASHKITLYWSALPSASGYDVYRSTASTGPFVEIASGIDTPDTGPGVTNELMWSDNGAGLPADSAPIDETDYYYYVVAVDSSSGQETFDSDQADAMSGPDAIPWDTGDPTAITKALAAYASYAVPPDIDPGDGTLSPAQLGFIVAGGPDGVVYQSQDLQGGPAAAYAPTRFFDPITNEWVDGQGNEISPAPSFEDYTASAPSPSGGPPAPATLPQTLTGFTYNAQGGPIRKIESEPGYVGIGSIQVFAPTPTFDPSMVNLAVSSTTTRHVTKIGIDAADIYMGGGVYESGGTNPNADHYPCDAGMSLASSNETIDPGYQPFIGGGDPLTRTALGATWPPNLPKIQPGVAVIDNGILIGTQRVLLYPDGGDPMEMSFSTTATKSNELQGLVVVHFRGDCETIARGPGRLIVAGSGGPIILASVTMFGFFKNWNIHTASSIVVKRCNSIAQNIALPVGSGTGADAGDKMDQDGSYLYDMAWGGWLYDTDDSAEGSLISSTGSVLSWTDSNVWNSGSYPGPATGNFEPFSDRVYYRDDSDYFMEAVNISTTYNDLLSSEGEFNY